MRVLVGGLRIYAHELQDMVSVRCEGPARAQRLNTLIHVALLPAVDLKKIVCGA